MSHFEADAALDQIEKQRPTILYPLFPTIAIPILRHPRFAGLELDSIRLVVSVATTPVQQDIQSRLPKAVLVSAFGMTETTGIVTFNRATDSLEERTSTVGSALPGWDIKIVDSETRTALKPGQRGEIAVRGPALFSGYLNEPALTARSFDPEGYFHTGDCGKISSRLAARTSPPWKLNPIWARIHRSPWLRSSVSRMTIMAKCPWRSSNWQGGARSAP